MHHLTSMQGWPLPSWVRLSPTRYRIMQKSTLPTSSPWEQLLASSGSKTLTRIGSECV